MTCNSCSFEADCQIEVLPTAIRNGIPLKDTAKLIALAKVAVNASYLFNCSCVILVDFGPAK